MPNVLFYIFLNSNWENYTLCQKIFDDAWISKGSFMQTKHLSILIHIWTKGEVGAPWNLFKPSSKTFLLTVPRRCFFCGSFVLFMSCVCHAFASVHCCLVVTLREKADLLALVCDVYWDFVTFPFGFLGQVWYLIVSISDPCCLSYFGYNTTTSKAIIPRFPGVMLAKPERTQITPSRNQDQTKSPHPLA